MFKHALFIGYGQLAQRLAKLWSAEGVTVSAVGRRLRASEALQADGVAHYYQGDVAQPEFAAQLAEHAADVCVITLTPSGRDANAYKQAYFDAIRVLVCAWQNNHAPKHVIFVSSTRVYGQTADQWVTEDSETAPQDAQGHILFDTEQHLLTSLASVTILRFSGIYSAQRDFLLRAVRAGNLGGASYTNRIHEDDCIGVMDFIATAMASGRALKPVVLASDLLPERSHIVREWLANQLSKDVAASKPITGRTRMDSKRCDSGYLQRLGYTFRYPTYREGYLAILAGSGVQVEHNQ